VDEFFEPRTDVEKDRIEQGINDLVTFILRDDPSVVGKDAIRTIRQRSSRCWTRS
jgi:hypothetical protein